MKILIAGGAGYIGSVLVGQLLRQNNRVKVLDSLYFGGESLLAYWNNPNFEFIRADVRHKSEVTEALWGMDAVVNLASIVGEEACNSYPKDAKEINRDGAIYMAREASRLGVSRYIFISTCSNYGISKSGRKATEGDLLNPISLYSQTKADAEAAIVRFASSSFFPIILRLGTVFGLSPRMRFDLIVNEFLWQAYQKKPLILYQPSAWRPLVHVADVSRAIITVLSAPPNRVSGKVFNIGYNNYQKLHIAQMVRHTFSDSTIREVAGGDKRDYVVSFMKARRELKFRAAKSLEEGINEIAQALRFGVFANIQMRYYTNRQTLPL